MQAVWQNILYLPELLARASLLLLFLSAPFPARSPPFGTAKISTIPKRPEGSPASGKNAKDASF